jgi:O-acetylserine/cysteine efflux transporter
MVAVRDGTVMRPAHKLQAVLVTLIWGVNFVAIDVGLRDFPPLLLTALRFTAAAVPLVLLVPRPTARARYVIGYGLLLGVFKFGVLFTAIHAGMPAGLASLVLQAQALFSVLLATVLLGERPGALRVAGLVVGSVGIGLLAAGRGAGASLAGFALTVFAAASWAVANVVVRSSGERRPLSLLVWSSLVPPLPLLGLCALVDGPSTVERALTGLSWRGLAAVGFIAYVSTIVGFGLWNRLIGQYSVARVAPFSLLVPVFGLAAAALALHEPVGTGELLAALVVLAGLALVISGSAVPARPAPDLPAPAVSDGSVPAPERVVAGETVAPSRPGG